MVLVVCEDLLFRSKISTAAKGIGIQIAAARSADAAIDRAREQRPAVIILDLDSERVQPFEVLRRLQEDPDLGSVPTIGFVSHVHADAIREARTLGIGEVFARSAFAAGLPAILDRYDAPATSDEP
jgi:CheY-like chemotaxis protein